MQKTTFFQMNLPGVNDPAYIEAINDNTRKVDSLLSEVPQSFSVATKGYFLTVEELQAAHPTGSDGDAYIVGTGEDAGVYAWTPSGWASVGKIQGPTGATGPQGPQGPAGPAGPQGPAGASGVLTVNGQAPDSNGNVNVQAGVSYLPNILDNTDFLNPINQKGETSYSGSGYGIDRWSGMSRTVLELVPEGVQLSNNNPSAGSAYWQQQVETSRINYGTPYTFGIKVNGTLYCVTSSGAASRDVENGNVQILMQVISTGNFAVRIVLSPGYTGTIVVSEPALYPGTFTEENFPLFTRPNYAEELAKCQRYFVSLRGTSGQEYANFCMGIADTSTSALFLINPPVTMRSDSPAIVTNGAFRINNAHGTTGTSASVVGAGQSTAYSVRIKVTHGGNIAAGSPVFLQSDNDRTADIYLDANL